MFKKNLFNLGVISLVFPPISILISCGSVKTDTRKFDLLPTYTGQADQMIALGIKSDYYPLQLNEKEMYAYLKNPKKHMYLQDKAFQIAFANKIQSLIPKIKGMSWWNQKALNSDESGSDPVYWKKQEGKVVLYEHYLLDDDSKIIDNANAPKHNPASVIQTNFRSSRDPYTRIPKAVFFGWDLNDDEINQVINSGQSKSVKINDETVIITAKNAKIIKKLKDKYQELKNSLTKKSDWLYNDYYFVDFYHRMFLDNIDFQNSQFKDWLIDSTKESAFQGTFDKTQDAKFLKQLFDASTFQSDEIKAGIGPISAHHPIYEQQQGAVGAAPMFEGAMRDNMLYLFNISWQLSNLAKYGTTFGQQHYNELPSIILKKDRDPYLKDAQSKAEADEIKLKIIGSLKDEQKQSMEKAFDNANKISSNLKTRMIKMKDYFNELGANGKTFGITTIAPDYGESTIQSISKYSFVYKELGFKQPLPSNLEYLSQGAKTFINQWNKVDGTNPNIKNDVVNSKNTNINDAIGSDALFNMDDNGWYWILGTNNDLNTIKMDKFENQFDMGVITTRNKNFDSDLKKSTQNQFPFAKMFKDGENALDIVKFLEDKKVDYDLWNEGIKTQFVMHMVLDDIINVVEKWYKKINKQDITSSKRDSALNWGEYFRQDFAGLKK